MEPKCNSCFPVRGKPRGTLNVRISILGEAWSLSSNSCSPQKREEPRYPKGARPCRHVYFSPGMLTSDLWLPEKVNLCSLKLPTHGVRLSQQPQKLTKTLQANSLAADAVGENARDPSQPCWSEVQTQLLPLPAVSGRGPQAVGEGGGKLITRGPPTALAEPRDAGFLTSPAIFPPRGWREREGGS